MTQRNVFVFQQFHVTNNVCLRMIHIEHRMSKVITMSLERTMQNAPLWYFFHIGSQGILKNYNNFLKTKNTLFVQPWVQRVDQENSERGGQDTCPVITYYLDTFFI